MLPTPLTASGTLTPASSASGIATAGPVYAKSCVAPGSPTVIVFVADCGDSAPTKLTRMFSWTVPPSGKPAGTVTVKRAGLGHVDPDGPERPVGRA